MQDFGCSACSASFGTESGGKVTRGVVEGVLVALPGCVVYHDRCCPIAVAYSMRSYSMPHRCYSELNASSSRLCGACGNSVQRDLGIRSSNVPVQVHGSGVLRYLSIT